MSDDAPVTLPLHCAYCHGAVTLQLSDWPTGAAPHDDTGGETDSPPMTVQSWTCPYCGRANSGGFPGRLAWVTKGHEDVPMV